MGGLLPSDVAKFEHFGISTALLARAGIRRVTDCEARDLLTSKHCGNLAGIAYRYLDPTTSFTVSWRVRRDHPEIEGGKPRDKYLTSYGDHAHVYFPPGAGELLADVSVPVVLVEAATSALALVSAATRCDRVLLPIALGGCYGWRTSKAGITTGPDGARVSEAGLQPDLARVTWTARDVVILFDSNSTTNPKVQSAQRRLAETLQARGAKVRIGTVPAEPGVNGPDDYRGEHDDAALLALVDAAGPVQPASVDDVLVDVGLDKLTIPVDLGALETALHSLRDLLRTADPIRRTLTRAAVVARLKDLKVSTAASIVDSALGSIGEADQAAPALVRDDSPWPEPVDGATVLHAVVDVLHKYLVLPAHAADTVALWICHAYMMPAWNISPLLALVSPTKRCGKTTALLTIGALVPRAVNVSNLTAAVLFRLIDTYTPTLLADEADTWLLDEASELRGIYNSGHVRGAAVVARCDGDDHEVRLFSTWAPKVIAMIGRPPGTIEDRSILVELRRKSAGESVARLRLDRIEAETVSIRQSLRRWANDHLDELREADPAVPASLNDRAQDNYRPLLALADAIGGPWPARARAAALALGGDEAAEDARTELLADIKVVFEAADNPVVMASADIIKGLVDMEDRPWSEWSKGKPITGSKLARTLKSFQVTAAGTVRIGTKTAKGYRLEAFTDAFERYLPRNSVFKASHRNNPNETGPESTIPKSHTVEACDGLESAVHARKHCACYGVTLPNGVSGEVDHEVLPAWVTEASEPDPGDPIGERDEDD